MDNLLDVKMGPNDAEAKTVRDYFKELLRSLWDQGEGFSGKRPFGNSGWEHEIIDAFKSLDDDMTEMEADILVYKAIDEL